MTEPSSMDRHLLQNSLTGHGKSELLDALLEWKSGASLEAALVRHGLVSSEVAGMLQTTDGRAEGTGALDSQGSTCVGGSAVPTAGGSTDSGRYRKVRSLAKGGLGEVFVALDEELQRDVALKEIQAKYADDTEARRRFVREAQVTGKLEHPGIVPVYGLGIDVAGRPYYAMRFIKGEGMDQAVERYHQLKRDERPLALRRLLGQFVAVCNAVGYAHSKGVIHRDLKPANVMLGAFGETLVVDWGLARMGERAEFIPTGAPAPTPIPAEEEATIPPTAGNADQTQQGRAMGTPAFMPPEQAGGQQELVGPCSDVFSLGAMLYCILTGQPPYRSNEAIFQAVKGEWQPARQVKKDVPRGLEAICAKAMAKEPGQRYATAQALAQDVEAWLADEPVSAMREPAWDRIRRWGRKHRTLVTSGVGVILVGVLGLVVGLGAVSAEQARTAEERDKARENEQRARKAEKEAKDNLAKARKAEREAKWNLSTAKANMNRAVKAEQEAKGNLAVAEGNLKLAKKAVNETFDLAKNHPVFQQPNMRAARKLLLEKALPFYKQFRVLKANDFTSRRELADQLSRVGFITTEIGSSTEARKAYEQARDIQKALVRENPRARELRNELAITLNRLGMAFNEEGKRAAARTAYEESREVVQQLIKEDSRAIHYQQNLAATLNNLGNLLKDEWKRTEALKTYEQARDILVQLIKIVPNNGSYQETLAALLGNMGLLLKDLGRKADAITVYKQGRETLEALVKSQPGSAELRSLLAHMLTNSATLLEDLGNREEALRLHNQARAIGEQLVKDHPSVIVYRLRLAANLCDLGVLHLAAGRCAESLAASDEAIKLLKLILKQDPRSTTAKGVLRNTTVNRYGALVGLKVQRDTIQEALTSAQAGDHRGAMSKARDLAAKMTTGGDLYDLGRVAALCTLALGKPSLPLPLRERLGPTYADASVAWLQAAHKAGHFKTRANRNALRKESDFAPLRPRNDFKGLLKTLRDLDD